MVVRSLHTSRRGLTAKLWLEFTPDTAGGGAGMSMRPGMRAGTRRMDGASNVRACPRGPYSAKVASK